MTHSRMLATPVAFNAFLYAGIGDDKNGMELTLLSALARQNMDPWQQAADLSQLPGGAAMLTLETLLKSMPGHESPLERTALAGRLLALLPPPAEMQDRQVNSSPVTPQPVRSARTSELSLVVFYFIAMALGGWWFSDHTPAEVSAQPGAVTTSPAAEPTSTSADH